MSAAADRNRGAVGMSRMKRGMATLQQVLVVSTEILRDFSFGG
jgi:hypothetical protein